jgi:hypothetical protein
MIFEDKLIVENTLSLMVGCILHKNELYQIMRARCGRKEVD